MSNDRGVKTSPELRLEGAPFELASQLVHKVVLPLALEVASKCGLDGLRGFYSALLACSMAQARGALSAAEVEAMASAATRQVFELSVPDEAPVVRH